MKLLSIFLGGSFQSEEEERRLREIYELLVNEGYNVWWAPINVGRGYESKDESRMKRIIETEEKEIERRDVSTFVMRRATFGTAMEIKHAFDHGKHIIGYILSDSPDFNSASFRYRVRDIVRNDQELLDGLRNLESKLYH
jgi:nucleoside 2-deoxyribosyltransferase